MGNLGQNMWTYGLLVIGLLDCVLGQTRTTESGAQCSFPQVYEGFIHTDCYEVDGSSVCRVGQNLEKCTSAVPALASTTAALSAEPVLTGTGQQCQFPFQYNQYEYYKCIYAAGAQKCIINGDFQDCIFPDKQNNNTDIISRRTTDGRTCEIPFVYYGDTYNNCAQISGKEYCVLNNTWESCAPEEEDITPIPTAPSGLTLTIVPDAVPVQEQSTPSETRLVIVPSSPNPPVLEESSQDTIVLTTNPSSSPMILPPAPAIEIPKRTTVDGRECSFPFVYKGKLFQDCAEDSGKEVCLLESTYVECVPLEGGSASNPVPTPEISPASPLAQYSPPSSPIVPRETVTGQQCEFPFLFGPYNYTKCILYNNTFSCMVEGEMLECTPPDSEPPSSIFSNPNTPVLVPLAPLIENRMMSPQYLFPQARSTANQSRETVNGQVCDFPIAFNDQLYYDCISLGGKEQCMIGDQWLECAPDSPAPTPTPSTYRVTTRGENCTFPFMYNGIINTDCFVINNTEYCSTDNNPVSDNSKLQECEPISQFGSPATKNIRYTFDGQVCTFPNSYEGIVYDDCFEVQDQYMCEVDGILNPCDLSQNPAAQKSEVSSESGPPIRFTTDGDQCTFPNLHRGKVYYDCFREQDQLSCEVNGILKQCMDITPNVEPSPAPAREQEVILESVAPQVAERKFSLQGEQCDFPFEYNNAQQYTCVERDGKQQCQVNGNWADCQSENTAYTEDVGKDEGLSSPAIGGIVFAVLFVTVVAIAVALVVLYFYRKSVMKGKYREMEKKGVAEGEAAHAGGDHPVNGGATGPTQRPNHMQFLQSSVELSKV